MAYVIDTATSAGAGGLATYDLLDRIKTFLTGLATNPWTAVRDDRSTANWELILQGPGLSGTEQIFIGFKTYQSAASDYYNFSVATFTGYVAGNTFETQPGYSNSLGVPAHNLSIGYWMIANGQRIAGALKVGTPVYESFYAGKFFPYATPSQYPYPIIAGGMLDSASATRYSDTSHSMPYKGNRANLRMRGVAGTYLQPNAFPWSPTDNASSRRDTGGQYPLRPIQLLDGSNIYGELDGIYQISGFNNVVENMIQIGGTPVTDNPAWTSAQRASAIVTAGGTPYVVIQDVYRTGFADYYAMKLA